MTLKRPMAPNWPIEKKTKKYVIKPKPGPHSLEGCMPLAVILRDLLGYARGMEEVRVILNAGHVKVDGKVRKERGFPVGLMDTVTIGDENFRVVVDKKGLVLKKIKSSDAAYKLFKIADKNHVKGRIQLNLHDGRNMFVSKDVYKTGDVIVYDLGKKTIRETVKMEKGALALITGGGSMGRLGKITNIIITKSSMPNQVVVDLGDRTIELPKDYIFVVGRDEPVIPLGE